MIRALLVADDLTGALDSAVAFAERGLRTVVARRPSGLREALWAAPDVLAVSTATREGSREAAIEAVRSVVSALEGSLPPVIFKKVDSRLKGHVAAESEALARATGRETLLIAPAIPDLGRIVREKAVSGHGIDAPISIPAIMGSCGLACEIPDAMCDADHEAALAAAPPSTLLVGARGLAIALAHRLSGTAPEAPALLSAPVVLAIGSRDPVTLEQVAELRRERGVREIPAPNGRVPPLGADVSREAGGVLLVRMVPGPVAVTAGEAASVFAVSLADALRRNPPATLLACGGETADALLGELGVATLTISGEILPGVPVSTGRVGGREVAFVTKSGGFGTPDVFSQLVSLIDRAAKERLDPTGAMEVQ
ncbi:Uncharacterized conserved protein YgbK, DUF1537 family [Faunimonas pinastri]|uniref:Uncharacterized conserved protein YgbK, DUF1537 family n=1 Tax=Faunimonas pinastri TaxID=1855383 RepID=A0A1H9IKG7_9HYPH|nr:four-carbon acid sugar kinase family protein [Faunimonas pinastri]SEQ75084.1 Uncharacterized conserved protein YgbK, DUF1537 family [Faunimonas pinastri]